ncbi:DUF421 domain-containing protein [Oceanobacillus rekensis]|uniref:DUF421 domain-containing protein n=1 Tax=Oceanobacillus rekensis TaxID=937927 RepID=UPI001120F225|nr:DUF421 domain-containing protein [Oceanobacillus rekensis]
MEFAKELLILLVRIITILPLLLLVTLFMGKRSIGELPVFDFLIFLSLGAVVGADIADPNIEHIHTAVAIILIGILQKVISKWKIRNRSVGKKLTFEPTVVMSDGKFIIENMKKIQYSIDNVLMMLRQKDVFDTSVVKMAIIEANGNLSVLRKPSKSPVSKEDMNIYNKPPELSYPLIVEGKLYTDVLEYLNLNESWLNEMLKKLSITNMDKVFFASVDYENNLQVTLKTDKINKLPRVYH